MSDNFESLKEQLDLQEWPSVYFFKFIIPNEPECIAETKNLFGEEADVSLRPSKNDKYVSVSVKELMLNSEAIIERYKKATKIKGLIAL